MNVGTADPVANAAVEVALLHTGASGMSPHDLLHTVERLAAAGDDACRRFVAVAAPQPAWVAPPLLEAGQRLGLALAAPTGLALLLGGLLEVYDVPAIAGVLSNTGRLGSKTWHRMLETGRFIRDIHRCGALTAGGEGTRGLSRIRLLHAMIRTRLARRGQDAITEDQMAFTLCAHSHVVRRSLARLGFPLSDHEARAHQHLWRVVGHKMGVCTQRLPRSPQGEAQLYHRLRASFVRDDSTQARSLTAHAINTIATQAHIPRTLVEALAYRLVGGEVAERLDIPTHRRWASTLGGGTTLARVMNSLRRTVPPVHRVFASGGLAFANAVLSTEPHRHLPLGVAATNGAFSTLSTARRRGLRQCATPPVQ